jgi:hypothetical protein
VIGVIKHYASPDCTVNPSNILADEFTENNTCSGPYETPDHWVHIFHEDGWKGIDYVDVGCTSVMLNDQGTHMEHEPWCTCLNVGDTTTYKHLGWKTMNCTDMKWWADVPGPIRCVDLDVAETMTSSAKVSFLAVPMALIVLVWAK